MKVDHGIEMLELEMNMMGNRMTIHPTLLYDDHHAVLVDVAMPGQLEAIQSAVKKAGVPFENIDAVILTHQDIDHIGSIQDVLKAVGKPIDVYAHAEDKPYIEGDKTPIKMTPERVSAMLAHLPEDARKQAEAVFLNPPTAKVTKVVADGEILPFFGGIQVIFTPGHTPGHISLYHQATKTLITGDATVSQNGKIVGPNPQATPDMPLALESQKKFTSFDILKAICYHGGLCDEHVNEQFRDLAK
ncbi:MBL fold metallo-hydrolase [Alicyclobacillus fastidiosus]|uniref:MBL fold metallo-hydrolase n=1 Tax=Alicyclobacillus fastidiosus TaxID=392011 RepID=A0ABY6ZF66_9BACL|nr:MBL fold metallo-hydrolase [Alicyclobacillus fastidiosus]WAH41492.1 MBL fold metallo-hydrolase [Alicyclobacillus fastidiosus]GMA63137.1 hydrolase [Alicyclobacillus fastidiosus]